MAEHSPKIFAHEEKVTSLLDKRRPIYAILSVNTRQAIFLAVKFSG